MAADQLSRVFSALADPTRRDMVARLAVGDATVNELAEPYDVTVQAVSKHLKVLEDAGLVSRTRDAQRRPCHLEAEVFDLMTKWIERYRQEAEERFSRLDDVLARMRRSRTHPVSRTREETHHERRRPQAPQRDQHRGRTPTVPMVTITREFDAPVALVFRAYTEPDLFRQWIGPRNRTFELQEFDCRTGGAWRYSTQRRRTSRRASSGPSTRCGRDERIVQTFTFEGFPDGVALETATFEDLGGGRSRVTSMSLVDSFEDRDAFVASGMETGVVEGYEKLDELLETLA